MAGRLQSPRFRPRSPLSADVIKAYFDADLDAVLFEPNQMPHGSGPRFIPRFSIHKPKAE
jgi:hypothetical protein